MIPLLLKEETTSTNDDAWAAWDGGRREPLAFMALRQTRGRGRLGREWFSGAAGNLHLSALLPLPAGRRDELPFVPLMAALAAVASLSSRTGQTIGVKWPNDLLVGERKCGGVLAESRISPGAATIPLVVGLGLNLNCSPAEFPEHLRNVAGAPDPPPEGRFPAVDIARDILYHVAAWFETPVGGPPGRGEGGQR